MELNRFNQLKLEETDEILEESFHCPKCLSKNYSSIYLEKSSSKNPTSWSIDLDSVGPSKIFFMKCACENQWTEQATVSHHRPRIKGIFMKSCGK